MPRVPCRHRGGLDLEDANDESTTVFSGIADAVKTGLLPEAAVDRSVSRLMYVSLVRDDALVPLPHVRVSSQG